MRLRVLMADDHAMVRQGLKALLEQEGFEVVAEAEDGREAVRLAQDLALDIAILDISMPSLNGLDAAKEILRASPRVGVILLTVHAADHQVVSALRAGIKGYVLKTHAAEELVRAIHEVSRGGTYLSPRVSRVVIDAYLSKSELPPDPLSPRERQVLQLVAEGKTTKEIAAQLDLTTKTAESYRAKIMEKLDIHDTAGLVRYAIRQGLIQP
ncbi:MAG: response regulator transcription factor [candidate division NC10 bacterium]|nr:response regulator transcription factor [candidate division NC10 bacterium]